MMEKDARKALAAEYAIIIELLRRCHVFWYTFTRPPPREPAMTLAPIRGAPLGASIPDFPVEKPPTQPSPTTARPTTDDQRHLPAGRHPHAPIEIPGDRFTLTFRVIPEQPAISRPSMTIHVVVHIEGHVSHTVGLLKMSASDAVRFLTDLRNRRSPIIAKGDEDGTVEIECAFTGSRHIFSVRALGKGRVMCRVLSDVEFNIDTVASRLLADLGV
jgi:hypothetical protein